ncbi:hypothetical protein ACEQ8H_000344 [Pleosporales sp. CAS-2024a]
MFTFVSVSHPDEIKDRKKQGKLRQHAIRAGIQRSKAQRAKKEGVFVAVEMGNKTAHEAKKRTRPDEICHALSVTASPSLSRMDPFDTLCGCPERLGNLMRQRKSGKPLSPRGGMEAIFNSALTDPCLFHALSLVLSLATNNHLPDMQVLTHRGHLLKGVRANIEQLNGVPQVSTITGMLLLIGFEYRIDGGASQNMAAHLRGVQTMMKICQQQKVALVDEVQRALFWQDVFSCLMSGTRRLLSHRDFQAFQCPRHVHRQQHWTVPSGFAASLAQWPPAFALVLRDVNSLCWRVDRECGPDIEDPLQVFAVDNHQANLASRLVDLLSECRSCSAGGPMDPWYEAALLVTYLCTYQLSTGVWKGSCMPELVIAQLLRLVQRVHGVENRRAKPPPPPPPSLLLWLCFASGAMSEFKIMRERVSQVIRLLCLDDESLHLLGDWEVLKDCLTTFIWCEHSMNDRVYAFYKEVSTFLSTESTAGIVDETWKAFTI